MVKTLRPPGPWLSCYSCLWSPAPPLLPRPPRAPSSLALSWHSRLSLISLDTVVSCLKSILRTLRILDAVPEHPLCGAVLGLHVTCPPLLLRKRLFSASSSGFSTPRHVAVCIISGPIMTLWLFLGQVLDEGLKNSAETLESLFFEKRVIRRGQLLW